MRYGKTIREEYMAKIVCIDDDIDVLETCKLLLTEAGHSVETATTEKDGLAKTKEFNPDLIMLDLMMEDITTGFHLAYNFRSDDVMKFKPILMLTSINQKPGANLNPDAEGEFLPVDAFIEKPIRRETLLNSVNALLSLPKEKINVSGRNKVI